MILIITISLSIIVAAIAVYLLLNKRIFGINYSNKVIKMSKHPESDTRTGRTGPFLILKLKYTVIQNELIDVTNCSAGLPLINVKVPGWYSVTMKGVLRFSKSIGSVARFGIMQDSNISNMYFREDSPNNGNNEYSINVKNRCIFIDKPVRLRYGIMYDPNTPIHPYDPDIELEMFKVA
jgi:hypothetical protein